jgi:ubiquinone/menaquinone biosynthesis C-methylase UbiE
MVNNFNPALYYRFLTPYYDWLFKCLLPDKKIRATLKNHFKIDEGATIIDLGCGTATLTIQLSETFKNATVIGIDADAEILAIAGNKLNGQLTNLQFVIGNCTQLQFQSQTIDAVVSSFLFCNLTDDDKQKNIAEAKRVLKTGGCFYIVEWGKPASFMASSGFYILQLLGGFKNTNAIRKGLLFSMLTASSLKVKQFHKINTVLGTIYFYGAKNCG